MHIIKATAEYLSDVKKILFIHLLMLAGTVGFFVFWVVSGVYLISIGETEWVKTSPFGQIKNPDIVTKLTYFHGTYLVWSVFFINHLGTFVMVSVACIWYFA